MLVNCLFRHQMVLKRSHGKLASVDDLHLVVSMNGKLSHCQWLGSTFTCSAISSDMK